MSRASSSRAVLGETEDTGSEIFRQNGAQYEPPTLALFSGKYAQLAVSRQRRRGSMSQAIARFISISRFMMNSKISSGAGRFCPGVCTSA